MEEDVEEIKEKKNTHKLLKPRKKKYKNSNKVKKNRWQRPHRLLILRQPNIKSMEWWQPQLEGSKSKQKKINNCHTITSKLFSQIKMKLFSSVLFYFATPTRPNKHKTHILNFGHIEPYLIFILTPFSSI